MRFARSIVIVTCASLATATGLFAQAAASPSPQKPVSIVCLCADSVGQAYQASLQDTFRHAPAFSLANSGGVGNATAVHIRIASHPTAATPQKRAGTMILVEAIYGGTRIVQQLEICERLSVEGLADRLLHSVKEVVAEEDADSPESDAQVGQS